MQKKLAVCYLGNSFEKFILHKESALLFKTPVSAFFLLFHYRLYVMSKISPTPSFTEQAFFAVKTFLF